MPLYDAENVVQTTVFTDYKPLAQSSFPSCAPPPPECTLGISGGTAVITNVTVRGDNDGSIYASVTGNTGTTISWYLNGVLKAGTAVTHTFNGLIAGIYNISAEEGICNSQVTNLEVIDGEFRTGTFVVVAPPALVAVENPVIMSLSTANNTGTPAVGTSTFRVTGTINDGDYVKITLEYPQSYTATFTAKNFPNKSDYILASVLKDGNGQTVGSNTTSEIATSLAEAMSNDLILARLYDFRVSTSYVYVTAKQANGKLNLKTGTSVTIVGNITCTETVIGNSKYDGQMTQNYSLYTDIWINKTAQYGTTPAANTFTKAVQLELPFQSNNVHYFDISNVLKNFVSTPQINFNITGYTTLADMMCAYKVEYGEKYPLIPNQTTKKSRVKGISAIKYCINSALPWTSANDMVDFVGETFGNLNNAFTVTNVWQPNNASYITIKNYLIDTGSTITTDIKFRIENNGNWTPWQSSPLFEDITGTTGHLEYSGITSGVTVTYSGYYLVSQYYSSYGASSKLVKNNISFLTNAPVPKQVQRDSSEYLYTILPKDYGRGLSIVADLYFYDGTVLTGETLYTITTGTTNWGGVYVVAAGYNELNLESYEVLTGGTTRKIRRVDFAIHQDLGEQTYPLTEVRSYRYEIDEQPRRFGVAFLNSLGVWDIFDFNGEIIDSVSLENQRMEVPRPISLFGSSPVGFQANTVYGTKVTRKHECNTGWIDAQHFDWLMELMASNRIYNYTNELQPFLIVESINYKKSSNDDLYFIDVVFTETLNENNISI